jgi:hypothetical protein
MTEDKKTNVIALFKKNADPPVTDSASKITPPSPVIQVGNNTTFTARDIHITITVSLSP